MYTSELDCTAPLTWDRFAHPSPSGKPVTDQCLAPSPLGHLWGTLALCRLEQLLEGVLLVEPASLLHQVGVSRQRERGAAVS